MNKKIKNYCYSNKCGPVVRTGFQHDFYFVCRQCKEEVTEHLAREIEDRSERKSKDSELDLGDLFGMNYTGKVDDGNDDGFY